ncbi:hypothetical protein GGI43DRAFT_202786 [Trichoderma evansii]
MLSASWYEYLPSSTLCVASAGIGTSKQGKKKAADGKPCSLNRLTLIHPTSLSLSLLFPPPLLRPLTTNCHYCCHSYINALLPMPHQSNIQPYIHVCPSPKPPSPQPVCGHQERQQLSVINSSCFNRLSASPHRFRCANWPGSFIQLVSSGSLPSSCLAAVGVLLARC